MSLPAEIVRSRYVSLTTFRRDGTGVATPVWLVMDGDEMVIVSDADAGKVKRIRRDGRVTVTACSARGKVAPGAASAEGRARLLDADGTAAARKLLARRYLLSRVGNWFARVLRMRKPPVIGIAVSF